MAEGDTSEWYMSADQWAKEWEKGVAKHFHAPRVSGIIQKHVDTLVSGRKDVKVLFPFCGKTFDMTWLANLGHTVVGCDCAPLAFKEFFEEQKLEYTTRKEDEFDVHTSADGKLIMYCGDFLKFSSKYQGQFDAIWDRGALNSVNTRDQKSYIDLMISLMKPDTKYLVMTYDSDDKEISDQWGMLTDEKYMALFGEKCNLQLRVEYVPFETYNKELMTSDEENMMEKLTIVTLKQ